MVFSRLQPFVCLCNWLTGCAGSIVVVGLGSIMNVPGSRTSVSDPFAGSPSWSYVDSGVNDLRKLWMRSAIGTSCHFDMVDDVNLVKVA